MATKKKPGKPAKATDPIAPALAVGEQLLRGFKEELTTLKNPGNKKQNIWQTLSEVQQDEVLARFSQRITYHFTRAFEAILAGGVPAVTATLAGVTFGSKGIKASLEISAASAHRHELADFAGKQILAILTDDNEAYLESMNAVTPDKDQPDLDLGTTPEKETDPRTVEQLTKAAVKLAEQLGEDDIDWSEKGRDSLIDYIAWAQTAIAKKDEGKEKGSGPTIN